MKPLVYLTALLVACISMVACSSKPPACSSPEMAASIQNILVKGMKKEGEFVLNDPAKPGASDLTQFIEAMKLSLSQVVSDGYDEKAKKFSCEGLLTFTMLDGSTVEHRAKFNSQLTDDGKDSLIGIEAGGLIIKDLSEKALAYAGQKLMAAQAAAAASAPEASRAAPEFVGLFGGQGDGTVELKVAADTSPDQFEIEMSTSMEGCAGGTVGSAVRVGNVLNIVAKDGEQVCRARATYGQDGAVSLEEIEGCSYFHGAACGFTAELRRK